MSEENQEVQTPDLEAQQTPQLSDVEQRAVELGWKPESEFKGDKSEFRSAREFLERGEMIGKIRTQSKQIQAVEQALKAVADQNKKVFANGYQKAIQDLKAQRREALADGDLVRAEDISEEIENKKEEAHRAMQEIAKPIAQVPQVDPEHEAWLETNQWYNDKVMQKFADSVAIEFIREHDGQVTSKQVRQYVTKTVKEEFPHRFEKKVVAAPNPDGEGRGAPSNTNSNLGKLQKVKASMTEEERSIMKTMIKSTGLTEKEYLEQYSN